MRLFPRAFKAIVNVDQKWGIGKRYDLMFRLPKDMQFFKEKTLNNVIVMGRYTLESLPGGKPLKDRVNIVYSHTMDKNRDDIIVVGDTGELYKAVEPYPDKDIFLIGGSRLYGKYLPFCDEVFVTKVDADGDADVFIENLDENHFFKKTYESEPIEDNGYTIRFTTYRNLLMTAVMRDDYLEDK